MAVASRRRALPLRDLARCYGGRAPSPNPTALAATVYGCRWDRATMRNGAGHRQLAVGLRPSAQPGLSRIWRARRRMREYRRHAIPFRAISGLPMNLSAFDPVVDLSCQGGEQVLNGVVLTRARVQPPFPRRTLQWGLAFRTSVSQRSLGAGMLGKRHVLSASLDGSGSTEMAAQSVASAVGHCPLAG